MSKQIIKPSPAEVAEAAASATITYLNEAIAARGEAVWVLAGGTAPMATYQLLASKYSGSVDWSKVKLLLGDERCVSPKHPDANWQQITAAFISKLPFTPANLFRPEAENGPEAAAKSYAQLLAGLKTNPAGIPEFDLVWIGMGEDGHTLSLFPHHPSSQPTEAIVIPVHNSPKPPPERITLTLKALGATRHLMIMTTGSSKTTALRQIAAGQQLPVAQAAAVIEAAGGSAEWFVDQAAAS